MRQILGGAPVSTGVKVGLNKLVSLFRSPASQHGADRVDNWTKGYLATQRGRILTKRTINDSWDTDVFTFQFNPMPVQDAKLTEYEQITYAGLAYVDFIWNGGGPRNISFQLFIDDTYQSSDRYFKGTDGKLAKAFKSPEQGGETKGLWNKTKEAVGDFMDSQFPKRIDVPTIEMEQNAAWRGVNTMRMSERGVLDRVEFLQSFLYPAVSEGEERPRFSEGGIVSTNQFRPPKVACLELGPMYLEGIIEAVEISYELYDKDLTPIRATADITFAAYEFYQPTRP